MVLFVVECGLTTENNVILDEMPFFAASHRGTKAVSIWTTKKSKTCVKRALKNKQNKYLNDKW